MRYISPVGYWILTLSHNVTIVGKIWLMVMILLRVPILLLAGYPLYKEQEVTCNTVMPGCATQCYDSMVPVSPIRYWLVQTIMVFLPYALFSVYVFHKVIKLMAKPNANRRKSNSSTYHEGGLQIEILDFRRDYVIHLVLRIVLELGFCVGQYSLCGTGVPNTFACTRSPCPHIIDCFISRPTEKSFLMILMWCIGAVSLILSLLDLILAFHRRCRPEKIKKQIALLENDSLKGVCSETPAPTNLATTSEQMVIYPGGPAQSLEKTDEFGNDHLITHRQAKTKKESGSNL
ncbi:gap junction delta-4 protein-like [Eleutherodactylus coqui]|uniref:Gap junction protein n=1 Tax=Eleutherodactylus coqui TaxID=57060 RepID=A0A8J6F8Y1_ELECQ|nr:hypothetical protein GDO78_009073 [Eleutherodactylus coqui]